MSPPDLIVSDRLDLVPLDADTAAAFVGARREEAARRLGVSVPGDWPDEHDEAFLRRRLGQLRSDPASLRWLARAVVLRAEGAMIGHAGFHGPPGVNGPEAADAVEIGYTIFPEHRGAGYATEAVRALIGWAGEQGVPRVIASVSPGNAPSLAIIRKLGFRQTGEQWDDEDGLELVFERATPGWARA